MPTTNPVPSTDPTDLIFNAQKLDEVVNGSAASYTDRLGVSRRSLAGIDAAADNVLNSIGYAVPVVYGSGISLTLTSQTVEYNGVVYAPKSSALPFTTSSWGVDSAKFRAVQVTDADLITYTPAGTGAVATTVQSKLREMVSVKDFGAVGDGVTDDTAAIQAAIYAARSAGADLFLPFGTYKTSSSLSISYNSSQRGLRIYGQSSQNYYSDERQSTIKFVGTTGYAISITGDSSGAGAPMFVNIDGVRFIGNASCAGAVGITRAWNINVTSCAFVLFGNASGGAVSILANGTGNPFAGIVGINKCSFANNARNVWLTGSTTGQINVVNISECRGLDQAYSVVSDWGGQIPFTSNITVERCLWEGTTTQDITSDGAANAWVIRDNYFENSSSGRPIQFNGASNLGILVTGNFFRKTLSAGSSLVYFINANGCKAVANASSFGGATDRYSVDFVVCTNCEGEPFAVTGAAGYPVRMNNFVMQTGAVNDTWSKAMPTGSGAFVGISSGDGWPGGTVATLSQTYSRDNAKIRVNAKATITTKSASGASTLIGILPYSNAGPDVAFPVYTDNVTGTKPFYAVLLNGGTTATVYDANGAALNYQTAVSAGSVFRYTFDYLTQQ